MTNFEREVMDRLFAGEDETLAILRQQCAIALVNKREFSSIGFFTTFVVPQTVERLGNAVNLTLDGSAELEGVENGASFILFIRDGVLDFLEGYVNNGV